ncbi:MAG: outer membrane protein assembly factor BamA [Acidobacteria bacterium]|nr:MAG: outer membrane protein assembly factor BamA [Acidobacteriota bacterium]PYX44279.1 MAG: outer membrane protein assembly factor BamA [Acidobacteriota bacterium]
MILLCPRGWAQQDLITEIDIHGNRRIPADTVKARIFTHAGDVYDPAGLERDFNSLWNTGYFEDVRFEREQTPKGWRIHVYVKEKPTIREINYTGLSSVSTSDVLDRFKERKVGLSVESQYDPTRIKKAEVAIKELLAEHGRQFASIRSEVRPIPPAAVGITFVVKEGPKVKVGRIRFQGNRNVNSRTLRAAMKNLKPIGVPHSIFLENIFAKTYDATKLEEDTERVRNEYQNRGFFKVLVQDPKTEIHDTGHAGVHIPLLQKGPGKAVDITMPIEEGDRYKLSSITFKNNKAITNNKALRALFPIKDGDIFSREKIGKGLENLRKAYGEYGYINFTSVPDTKFDDEKKLIFLEIDVDEGKQFYVRRIEFQGNTTTRDKVIRREIALEEGQVYNSRLWEFSLLRLNQLGYFDQLKPDDPNTTDKKLDEKEGSVDLALKVHEKGKNSIGLNGGVSGLEGAFIGLSYTTNNFLGLGETLQIQASIGNLMRSILFGFTEPYLWDRPLQAGFTVYTTRTSYNQARQYAILSGQQLNLPSFYLQNLQNYTQSSTGFTSSLSYPLHRSLKRVGITYSFDNSSLIALSDASKALFTNLAFRGISGPNALSGIITSKILPSFSINTLDAAYQPHSGKQLFIGGEFAGLGGTVKSVRPILQYKQFFPVQKRRNAIGLNFQGSFLSGYGGLVAPPFQRFYMGGENDLRGFDIRSVSPIAFLPNRATVNLTNPDGSLVLKDPSNPRSGAYTIPLPVQTIVQPGGDLSMFGNAEYRISIVGPVTLAPFMDVGIDPIVRTTQLRINPGQLSDINNTLFGCPQLDIAQNCLGGEKLTFSQYLKPVAGTNWTPRMSTGLELQVMLPVINAPFRIYWAYNPLRLDSNAAAPTAITRSMFPGATAPFLYKAAGDYTYIQAINTYGANFTLREPRKTFRFTVATTF